MFSGNNMLLIGILVVVLLALLVLLLVLNRRSAAKGKPSIADAEPGSTPIEPAIETTTASGGADPTPTDTAADWATQAPAVPDAGWTTPAPAPADAGWLAVDANDLAWTATPAQTPAVTDASAAVALTDPEPTEPAYDMASVPEPAYEPAPEPAPAESPAAADAVATAPAPRPPSTGKSDPVRTAVLALLEGVGELSQPETRRLELYRPERVLSVVNELEPTYAGKGKEQGRSRLARIRKYAQEFQEDLASTAMAGAGAAVVATAGAGLALAADTGEPEPDVPNADAPGAEEWPPEIEGADEDITAETAAAAQDAAATDPHALYAVPAYADEEVDEVPVAAEPAWVDETSSAAEPQWVDQPVVMNEVDEAPAAPAIEQSAESGALDSLQLDISTAEDLLALPPSERVDALSFLGPQELGRTFTQADDANLKRAAIDTLEQHGTQEALASIQQCFDDSDPELQVYAVDAADRLLAHMGGGGS